MRGGADPPLCGHLGRLGRQFGIPHSQPTTCCWCYAAGVFPPPQLSRRRHQTFASVPCRPPLARFALAVHAEGEDCRAFESRSGLLERFFELSSSAPVSVRRIAPRAATAAGRPWWWLVLLPGGLVAAALRDAARAKLPRPKGQAGRSRSRQEARPQGHGDWPAGLRHQRHPQ